MSDERTSTGEFNPGEFNLLDYPALFDAPRFISPASAWIEHIPLAMLMVLLVKPRVLVELGTHRGDSYFAFCQAVATAGAPTRCWAVDTWAGDDQTGRYGEEVFEGVQSHNQAFYAAFSTLLRAHFADAVMQFTDGQIDLLHIDGHHTYESVRNDFETWLPKMSERGVMLFHDTAAKHDPAFGVWKLWDELSARYPSFAMEHGYGLGILAVGANPPAEVIEFLRYANTHPAEVRHVFNELGQRVLAMRLLFHASQGILSQWGMLNEWRVRTGQPGLQELTVLQVFQQLGNVARICAENVKALTEDDLTLRAGLPKK